MECSILDAKTSGCVLCSLSSRGQDLLQCVCARLFLNVLAKFAHVYVHTQHNDCCRSAQLMG